MDHSTDVDLRMLVDVARRGGVAALRHYGTSAGASLKADRSPVTDADRDAQAVICAGLREIAPGVPVVAEESAAAEFAVRRGWTELWLVDPLDGTKEFLKGSGEFTVNIALVRDGVPRLGVVHVPVTGVTYCAAPAMGAWVERPGGEARAIRTRRVDLSRVVAVASKDHAGPEVEALLGQLRPVSRASMGSSLKFCLVAEGAADFYPRLLPTSEWDTAAAQCIVEAAGGRVTDLAGAPLRYNKEDLRNPSFLAFGDPSVDWAGPIKPRGAGE